MVLGGFLSVSLFQFLSYQAATTTTATNMAIVTALIPLLTIILSTWILKDQISYGLVIGGFLSFYGILYLLSHGHIAQVFSQGMHLGDGLMLLAAIGYALYRCAVKTLENADPSMAIEFCHVDLCHLICFAVFYLFYPHHKCN